MSPKLVQRGKTIRRIMDDLFEELSESSGTKLSFDDYYQNYSPDVLAWIDETKGLDFEKLWFNDGRALPNEIRFFGEMHKTGELAQREQDQLVNKLSRLIRSGQFKAHAGEAFENAVQIAKTVEEPGARRVLVEYLQGIRGFTDANRMEARRIMGSLYDELGLKIPENQISNVVDHMISLTYGGLMGWRPGLIVRNLTQPYNLVAPLFPRGFSRVAHAQVKAMRSEERAWAESIGAIRRQAPVTSAEVLEKGAGRGLIRHLNSKSISGYGHADAYNRAVTAITARDVMRKHVPDYLAGKITGKQLVKRTGMSVHEKPVQHEFFRLLDSTGEEAATNFIAREWSNFTQFLYGRANAPAWTRGVWGRVFGSYSTWPMGYLNWLRQVTTNSDGKGEVVSRLAKHGIWNAAILGASAKSGYDITRWAAWSSLRYGGGPLVDPIETARGVHTGGFEEEKFRSRLENDPGDVGLGMIETGIGLFVPGGTLLSKDIPDAGQALADGDPEAAFFELFGIRKLEEDSKGLQGGTF
jgi:hypothetical protein